MTFRRALHGVLLGLIAVCFTVGVAVPASASSATLKRAVTNLAFGPLDFALSPITGTTGVYRNLEDIDDSTGVRIVYAVPGVVWNTAFNMGGSVLRVFSGVLEMVPGILLLPFEADMSPLFAPPDRAPALIDEETDWLSIKIGINYLD
ncbi:MAG: hypothetical protein CL938_19940 [Deltaproteobacteria bacterium]|jgi:hypothetical protein|nr:hypothetical protein [Deltaproteobacteria bacterium]